MEVPREAAPMLVKALGAYLRAAPPSDLPVSVRRLREFRPRALAQHAGAVLGLLDDKAQTALIEQWLDKSKPPLSRAEVDALRIALARDDGWAEKLRSLAPPPKPSKKKDPPTGHTDPAEHERARVEKAREELRKAREERDIARRNHSSAMRELAIARGEIEGLKAELSDARKKEASAADALEKEHRKAERDVDKARRQAEVARRETKDVRRELAEATKNLEKLRTTRQSRPPKRPQEKEPAAETDEKGPRKPLNAPKGRLVDDPETLNEWLKAPGVRLLVDGYNVAFAKDGGAVRDLEGHRRRVVEGLATLMRMKKRDAIVIFDGSEVSPGTARRTRGPVRIEYSRPEEIADDHLIAKLEELPPEPVIVATNDRELQRRAARLGATIATSDQLLALIR